MRPELEDKLEITVLEGFKLVLLMRAQQGEDSIT